MASIIAQRSPLKFCYQANLAILPSVMLSNFHVMHRIKKKKKKQHLDFRLLHQSRFGSCNLNSIRSSRIISGLKGFNFLITM